MTRRILALLVTTSLLLAACGDDDDAPADAGPETEEPADDGDGDDGDEGEGADDDGEASDATGDQAAADEVMAALATVLEADGFVRGEDDDESEDGEGDGDDTFEFVSEECRELERIFGDEDELPGETASADLGGYERGDFNVDPGIEMVESVVGFTSDAADLAEIMAVLTSDLLPECFAEAIENELAQDAESEEMGIEADVAARATATSGVGDEAAAFELVGEFEILGFALPMHFEIEIVRVGRALTFIMVGSIGEPTGSVDRAELVAVLGQAIAPYA